MKTKYTLVYSEEFSRRARKFIKKQSSLSLKMKKSLALLSINPFSHALRSHKVKTKKYGEVYSSRITGDIRVLWRRFDKNILLLITIGTHDGRLKVYK